MCTPSGHYYEQKFTFQIYSINDVCGLKSRPNTNVLKSKLFLIIVTGGCTSLHHYFYSPFHYPRLILRAINDGKRLSENL